jgi:hypothetical protein
MGEIRLGITQWLRNGSQDIWPLQHMSGSRFVAPPSLPPIRTRSAGIEVNLFMGTAFDTPREQDKAQFVRLARWYAASLERSKMYYISPEMTHLAMRTQMETFRLTADMLPAPEGFLVWGQPIGDAERFIPRTAWLGPDGVMSEDSITTLFPSQFSPFQDAEVPVVGAAWKYERDHDQVWVTTYTRNSELRDAMISRLYDTREIALVQSLTPPLAFEREQALPLDRTLNWFDADPADGPRLELTAYADREHLPEHQWEKADAANADVAPQMTAMMRTLVATWMLMKWKIAHREEIAAPHAAVKRIARETGQTRAAAREITRTQVVRLGQPLRHRNPPTGAASRKWTVRAIIGPYIRTRQYIPAQGIFDYTPRLIAPYIAGPPGAPINNLDKVFLLE